MQNYSLYYAEEYHKYFDNKQNIDIRGFLIKVFETLHPNKKMINNWHLDLMIEYLKAVEAGDVNRLIVNLPPRSLKSICVNVAWPAWMLGHSPSTRIITVSYNQELSEKHSIDCRLVMQSDWYKELFPDTVLAYGMNTKNKFSTTYHGFRFATSVGGTLTGKGADVIIIDDPSSAADSFSYKKRKKTYEWFRSCLLSRLNDSNNGKIVLVMQRLHPDDLTGMLLRGDTKDSWRVLKIPAISNRKQTISFGMFKYERNAGEHLYENAFLIDSQGIKTSLQNKHSIMKYIKTCFDTSISCTYATASMPKQQYEVVINKLDLHECDWILYRLHWQKNIFCDNEVLYRYNFYYCQSKRIEQQRVNYDVISNRHFLTTNEYVIPRKIVQTTNINSNFNIVRAEVGSNVFNVQYQQEANVYSQSLIKDEWIQQYSDYNVAEIPHLDATDVTGRVDTTPFDYVYQSWDCAVKCGINNDYSVCSSWGIKNHKLYLLHILRTKIDYPKLRNAIFSMSSLFKPDAILIEDCAAGQQIIQEISANIIPIKPREDKVTRLTLVSPLFERGIVLLPQKAVWKNELLDELLNFPNVEHDDQVDSISQFLLWYQKNELLKKNVQTQQLTYKLNIF